MATRADLEKQLAAIQSGLLNFSAVGEESFFKQTGQTKLTKIDEIPRYTDEYNKEFQPIKDIQFTLEEDVSTLSTTDKAFYVFDPARTAKRKADQTIKTVEDANLAVTAQQEQIKAFLAEEKESAKSAILQTYLSKILNPQLARGERNPFEWESVDLNTPEGLAKWKKSKQREVTKGGLLAGNSAGGKKRVGPSYYVKLTAEESAAKKKLTEDIERVRFMGSSALQKQYASVYAKDLQSQIKSMLKQEEKEKTKAQKIQDQIDKLKAQLPK